MIKFYLMTGRGPRAQLIREEYRAALPRLKEKVSFYREDGVVVSNREVVDVRHFEDGQIVVYLDVYPRELKTKNPDKNRRRKING